MRDMIIGSLAIAIALFCYVDSKSFAVTVGDISKNPALFPQIMAIALAFLGGLLLFNTIREKTWKQALQINGESVRNVSKLVLSNIIYLIGIVYLGFPIATTLFVFATIWLLGGKRSTAAKLCIPITLGLYLVFFLLFQMPMPIGSLWE